MCMYIVREGDEYRGFPTRMVCWYILSMLYSRDIPFWSETLDIEIRQPDVKLSRVRFSVLVFSFFHIFFFFL